MGQEEKLLLQEFCERLPHGLFVAVEETDGSDMVYLYDEEGNLDETNEPNIHSLVSCNCYGECDIDDYSTVHVSEIKPYLRPMSSMTEEEAEEYNNLVNELSEYDCQPEQSASKMIDWLNRKMFDHRGLIPEGLALPAPEGMYSN